MCPLLTTVQWDGMEWTSLGFPSVSIITHSTVDEMGWNGHRWDSPGMSTTSLIVVQWDGMDICQTVENVPRTLGQFGIPTVPLDTCWQCWT